MSAAMMMIWSRSLGRGRSRRCCERHRSDDVAGDVGSQQMSSTRKPDGMGHHSAAARRPADAQAQWWQADVRASPSEPATTNPRALHQPRHPNSATKLEWPTEKRSTGYDSQQHRRYTTKDRSHDVTTPTSPIGPASRAKIAPLDVLPAYPPLRPTAMPDAIVPISNAFRQQIHNLQRYTDTHIRDP